MYNFNRNRANIYFSNQDMLKITFFLNLYCLVSCKIQIKLTTMIEEYREYKWYKIWIQKIKCIIQKIIIIIK